MEACSIPREARSLHGALPPCSNVPNRPAKGATSSALCFLNFWCSEHQPARRHTSLARHTSRHSPPRRRPRRALSAPTARHTSRHGSPYLRPQSALAPHCQQTPLAPSRTKRPRSRRHPVDNLWITWGKLTSHPRQPGSYPHPPPTYPQVIHKLSTRYPQVNSLHSMRVRLTYCPDTATLVLLACCAYRHRSPIKYRMLLLLLLDLRSYSL